MYTVKELTDCFEEGSITAHEAALSCVEYDPHNVALLPDHVKDHLIEWLKRTPAGCKLRTFYMGSFVGNHKPKEPDLSANIEIARAILIPE